MEIKVLWLDDEFDSEHTNQRLSEWKSILD